MSFDYQKVGEDVLRKALFWTVARLFGNNDLLPQRGRIFDTAVQCGVFFAGKSLVEHFVVPRKEFKTLTPEQQKVAKYALSGVFTVVTVLSCYHIIGQKINESAFIRNCTLYTVAAGVFEHFAPDFAAKLL